MTDIPIQLVIADAISMVFLTMGALILFKFAQDFGSKKIGNCLKILSALIIAFAILHEGIEITHGLYDNMENVPMLGITILIATSFFVMSLLIRREMSLTTNEVKKEERSAGL